MSIKLTFLGDIMCEKIQSENCYTNGKYDYSAMFDFGVKAFLKQSDYVIGNLETPVAGETLKYSNKLYSFNTPEEFLKEVKNIGVDLVSTANNHCLDRGIDGLYNTMQTLENVNMDYVGTFKNKKRNRIFIKEIGGIKFAILAYTYGTNAFDNKIYLSLKNRYMVNLFKHQEEIVKRYNLIKRLKNKLRRINVNNSLFLDWKYLRKVKSDIKEARKNADFVIMNMHSGGQYNEIVDDYTIFLANYLLKNDIDFIIGTHPHLIQEHVMLENKFCAYCLGNFACTPRMYDLQKNNLPDYSIVLNIYFDEKRKSFVKITFSIAKSVLNYNNFSKVYMLEDLKSKVSDREKKIITSEEKKVVEIFSCKKINELKKIDNEYILYEVEQYE